MNEDLHKRILADLDKSGVGSELRALKVFQTLFWCTAAGSSYYDRDEGKTREIDILAYNFDNQEKDGKVVVYNSFYVVAEVKKSEQPWIVFKSYRPDFLRHCAWGNMVNYINLPVYPAKLSPFLEEHSLLKRSQWEGAGIHHAFKDPTAWTW